jgi:hypothetical protein
MERRRGRGERNCRAERKNKYIGNEKIGRKSKREYEEQRNDEGKISEGE